VIDSGIRRRVSTFQASFSPVVKEMLELKTQSGQKGRRPVVIEDAGWYVVIHSKLTEELMAKKTGGFNSSPQPCNSFRDGAELTKKSGDKIRPLLGKTSHQCGGGSRKKGNEQ